MYSHITPGGWLECIELELPYCSDDGTFNEESELYKWAMMGNEATNMIGRPFDVANRLEGWFSDQGFENVTDTIVKYMQSISSIFVKTYLPCNVI